MVRQDRDPFRAAHVECQIQSLKQFSVTPGARRSSDHVACYELHLAAPLKMGVRADTALAGRWVPKAGAASGMAARGPERETCAESRWREATAGPADGSGPQWKRPGRYHTRRRG